MRIALVAGGAAAVLATGVVYAQLTSKGLRVKQGSATRGYVDTLKCSTNLTCTVSGGTATVVAAAGGTGTPGGAANDLQINDGLGGFGGFLGNDCPVDEFATGISTIGSLTCASPPAGPSPNAQYWTGAADATLSAEKNLGALGTGLVINAGGVPSAYTGATCAYAIQTLDASGAASVCRAAPTIPADLSAEPFITKVASANLSNEFALGSLATGLLKNITGTGVPVIAAAGTDYAAATSGSAVLLGDGSGGFSNYAGTSCTNQFNRSLSTAAVATCAGVGVADFTANQGTTTQVLHGNAAGQPSWTAVVDGDFSGQLALSHGGTNKNNTASNGAVIYSDASTFLPSAVGTSGQILSSTGAGAPAWIAGPRIIRVSGSNFTTTSATAVNITGLSITTAAATPYFFRCVLDATGTATGGPRAAVVVTTSTITSMAAAITAHTTSATAQVYTGASASGTLSTTCTASCLTTDIPIVINGMVNINANAGTITIAAANGTAGQTTTIKVGSMCEWWTP